MLSPTSNCLKTLMESDATSWEALIMDGTVDDGLLEEAAVLGCARGAEEGWFVLEKALELD